MPPPTSRQRKQLQRRDEPNEARFLTFSCFQRRPFLSKDRSRRWFIDALIRSRQTHGFHLWAYVIMPEHVHLLLWPGDAPLKMSDPLYTLKKSVTNRALNWVLAHSPDFLPQMEDRGPKGSVTHRFWQRGGGYDENLFSPDKIWQKIDYIHENPVRRGLCESPTDWAWSSARAYENGVSEPIAIDFESLPARTMR